MKAFLLWAIKNVRFAALIIAGIILGTCFIKCGVMVMCFQLNI